MLISTLLGKGVGATGKPGHFRTLFPFSVSGKTVVGLLLRRRPLYPAELRDPNTLISLSYVGKTLEKYKLLSSICQMKEMLVG